QLGENRGDLTACIGFADLACHGSLDQAVMWRDMLRRASSSFSVLNVKRSLSLTARCAAGRASISSTSRFRCGNFAQASFESTIGIRRAQPHTSMSTIVYVSPTM